MTEINLINKKSFKEYCNSLGYKVSEASYDALNEEIISVIDKAIDRTKDNGRKTLMSYDI